MAILLQYSRIARRSVINGTLEVDIELDTTSKSNLVARPDDMLLMLVQQWTRDESIFLAGDDRHDVATVMLFQTYIGGKPADFVHSWNSRASEDLLSERVDQQ